MGVEQQGQELTDVALCYQSLGLQLDASAEEIDYLYKTLTEEYKLKLTSLDPVQREQGRVARELLDEMYSKIQGSLSYCAAKRDGVPGIRPKRPVHHTVAQRSLMAHCPRCNGLIHKELKSCPICKSPIQSTMQRIAKTFTFRNVLIFSVVAAIISLVIAGRLYPDLFSAMPSRAGSTAENK